MSLNRGRSLTIPRLSTGRVCAERLHENRNSLVSPFETLLFPLRGSLLQPRFQPLGDLGRHTCELAEEEFFGAEFFDRVAEFGGLFEFEFFGGFAHVGFEVGDVGVEFLLGGEVGACLRLRR